MFAARLRQLRIERGLSPTQLGAIVGVSTRTISRWESGDGEPGISQAARIARALEVSLDVMSEHAIDATEPVALRVHDQHQEPVAPPGRVSATGSR